MILIDLSRDIEHKMAVLPNHPQVIITPVRHPRRGARGRRLRLLVGHHGAGAGRPRRHPCRCAASISTPIRTPIGIDQVPLENFFTEAVCLDLSHKPLKSDISIEDLEKAEQAAGVTIKPKDTVLLHMDFFRRTHGTPGFITDFPGLTKESATWLGNKGIGMFGVEAVSPGRPGRNNFEVHHVCRDLGFTHMEGLVNLDKLDRQGPLPLHRLPDQDQGRHRRADPRGGVAGWLTRRSRGSLLQRIMIRAAIIAAIMLTLAARSARAAAQRPAPRQLRRCGERRAGPPRRGALRRPRTISSARRSTAMTSRSAI